jgi:hypothetical protein
LFDSLGSLRVPSLVAAGALVVAAGLAVFLALSVTSLRRTIMALLE